MRRSDWGAVAGFGIAGLLLLAPGARADDQKSGSTTSQDAKPGSSPTDDQKSGAPGGTSEKEQRAESKASAGSQLSGKVETYDRANRTLSLANSDKLLRVTDDTQVFKGGDRVSPGQIMEGDEVRASFTGSGDTLEVVRIDVTAGAPASSGSGSGKSSGTDVKGGSPKGTAAESETGSGSTGTK